MPIKQPPRRGDGIDFIETQQRQYFVAYYQARGDFKKALEYQQQYQALNDSVFF